MCLKEVFRLMEWIFFQNRQNMRDISQKLSVNSKVFLGTLSPRPIAFSTYACTLPLTHCLLHNSFYILHFTHCISPIRSCKFHLIHLIILVTSYTMYHAHGSYTLNLTHYTYTLCLTHCVLLIATKTSFRKIDI